MIIQFLGTGAADWGINDRDSKGTNRFFSSALIDEKLLIDPGPHVFLSAEKHGIDLSRIEFIINTHPHSDHFNKETLAKLEDMGAKYYEISAGERVEFGGYSVTAYRANHSTCENSKHFIIEKDAKRLFYGLDSAWLMYEEVQAILNNDVDMAVLDATIGDIKGDYRIFEHNNLNMIREIKATLNSHVKRYVISHMARTLHEEHHVLAEKMNNEGIETAFDGFVAEI